MTPFNKLFNCNYFSRAYFFKFHTPPLSRTLSSFILCYSRHQSRCFSSSRPDSFMEVVKAVARQGSATSEKVAIRADQKSYSYEQLLLSAKKLADLLCNGEANVCKGKGHLNGARIGIVAKPSAEFVSGVLGTWFSGGVAVPLALSYPEAELLHVMNDAEVSMILSTEDHQELMQNVAAKSDALFSLIPSVHDNTKIGHIDGYESFQENIGDIKKKEDDAALIIYTSGTTGKPKGAVHTHRSIAAQVQTLSQAWEYTSADQFLNCLPLHHVHGLFNALLAPLYAGAAVEFMPKFSVRGIWQRWRESYPADGAIADDAITVFTGVPTMYTRLIQGYESMEANLRVSSASAARKLRLMMSGSSALPYPVMQQWETITGHRLLERYGMTEFVMAISNPLNGMRKGGTVGKPFPGVEVKILKENESGSDGTEEGELCIKSPSLFREYWKLPQVTKESFIDDGFFKTGDAVKVDEDGYYVILGRTSADIMKVGGYKLSALEIEAALLEVVFLKVLTCVCVHPTVVECCVLGLPDKDYGDAVCAIIVPDEDVTRKRGEEVKPAITLEELCDWAKEKLAPYKLPTRLFLWSSIPRNAMGKVNKKELKKKLAADEL